MAVNAKAVLNLGLNLTRNGLKGARCFTLGLPQIQQRTFITASSLNFNQQSMRGSNQNVQHQQHLLNHSFSHQSLLVLTPPVVNNVRFMGSTIRNRLRKARKEAVKSQQEKEEKKASKEQAVSKVVPHDEDATGRGGRVMKQSTGFIVDDWIPLEEKDVPPFFSSTGLKYRWKKFKQNLRASYSMGIAKKKLGGFQPIEFARWAEQEYIKALNCLAKNERNSLRDIVTDDAYVALRTKFKDVAAPRCLGSVERPRIVHMVVFPVMEKTNLYAQVTVRTALKMDPNRDFKEEEVIRYVLLEKPLSNSLTPWRIAGTVTRKYLPEMLEKPEPIRVYPSDKK